MNPADDDPSISSPPDGPPRAIPTQSKRTQKATPPARPADHVPTPIRRIYQQTKKLGEVVVGLVAEPASARRRVYASLTERWTGGVAVWDAEGCQLFVGELDGGPITAAESADAG
jgi:hypothetical protein